MSLLATIDPLQLQAVERHLARGLQAWGVPEPLTLEGWAREHFYLSGESSYVEQRWTPWPFQRALMACISNDDIAEINLVKSARVGYTKMLLAAIGYFAEHKRRNQALWQPTDDDAEDFVKSELDPMLRDVAVMRTVLPAYMARHRDNTLQQKRFIGSILRVKGGKAAKNYRRISIDVAYLDEIDAFDADVEKEGDPITLAAKRLEGATFPKLVLGSTPKLKGFSLVDGRAQLADMRFTYHVRCPQCGGWHALTWGGKDEPHGLKWRPGEPESAYHLCPHCAATMTQAEYLAAAEHGRYINDAGTVHLLHDGRFVDPEGAPLPAPRHVAFHVWTAYSPVVAWSQIVREFLAAYAKKQEGDDTKLKAFFNTTRGEAWEGEIERTDAEDLKARAEPYAWRVMPRGCLLLLCGMDTQDNRIEAGVWGLGRGGEMWPIDHQVFFGNPALNDVWEQAEQFVRHAEYPHACGLPQRIHAFAIDSGGHHTDAVYAFAHSLRRYRVHAIKGASQRERSIDNGNTRVGYRWNGRVEKHGPMLWIVGTNLAKDRFAARLTVSSPGPGYVHLCRDASDEWFKQLAGEVRAVRRQAGGTETRWTPARKRTEVKDCVTYAIWLEERLDLWAPGKHRWWDALERAVQPEDDLFTQPPQAAPGEVGAEDAAEVPPAVPPAVVTAHSRRRRQITGGRFDVNNW
ncbi:MAG: phage terminase large subunit family protein [Xanthomonadaceae bacterium]|nr:phage terminase large subunit family protein [Xanthomonadaceae bacterium]